MFTFSKPSCVESLDDSRDSVRGTRSHYHPAVYYYSFISKYLYSASTMGLPRGAPNPSTAE